MAKLLKQPMLFMCQWDSERPENNKLDMNGTYVLKVKSTVTGKESYIIAHCKDCTKISPFDVSLSHRKILEYRIIEVEYDESGIKQPVSETTS